MQYKMDESTQLKMLYAMVNTKIIHFTCILSKQESENFITLELL